MQRLKEVEYALTELENINILQIDRYQKEQDKRNRQSLADTVEREQIT